MTTIHYIIYGTVIIQLLFTSVTTELEKKKTFKTAFVFTIHGNIELTISSQM